MRPPICDTCDRRFDPFDDVNGGLVTFKAGPEDLEQLERLKQPMYVGHPPNQEWFCGEHIELARSFSDLTVREARAEIRKALAKG